MITPTAQPAKLNGYGIGVVYIGDDSGASIYHLNAALPAEPNEAPEQFTAAIVTVDHATRQITLSTPDATKTMLTRGLASWTFGDGDDAKRISGYSVRQYLGPRAAVLLARLHAA